MKDIAKAARNDMEFALGKTGLGFSRLLLSAALYCMWQYHVAKARTEKVDNREGKLRRPIYPLGGGGGIATMLS
ncbi:hypothetical protein GP486_000454 [Trichoglossum hirsutum]|uniref:Uncharacterized protein n=1 Tax=Trichoglossum hirsutum TaxID=265104 RepID=A0A9P8LIJ8_9PEZI|nr:hypothetical protein GP486_000454 [Trichoglossum hirsutum]